MINAIQTALSGLSTATKQVNQAANNIAKAGTEEGKDVNFAEEAVNLTISETAYKANLTVLKVTDELSEELLNTFDERV